MTLTPRLEKIRRVLSHRQPDLTIVMENIHDPHNVSAMLRSADAVGVYEVQLVYTNTKFPKIGKKSSSSASKWVGRRKFETIRECYDRLHDDGYVIYATRLDANARPLYSFDFLKKTALVFGNEHAGVTEEAVALADGTLIIPMMGMIQSLNVSVACAVTLYEALRQRTAAGMYDTSRFSPEVLESLVEEWRRK